MQKTQTQSNGCCHRLPRQLLSRFGCCTCLAHLSQQKPSARQGVLSSCGGLSLGAAAGVRAQHCALRLLLQQRQQRLTSRQAAC